MARCGPRVASLIALLALIVAMLLRPDGSQAAFVRGLQAYQNGDLSQAYDAFAQCVRGSRRLDCRSNLATVLAALGSHEEAVRHFRAVLAVEPSHGDAAFNLAGLLHAQADGVATAEEAHLRGVVAKADPSRWDLWAQFASALTATDQAPATATRALLRAVVELQRSHGGSKEETAHLTELYYALGIQLAELESPECADLISELTDVLGSAAASGCADAASGDGGSACDAHALEAYQKALELDPSHVQSEHMRAAICDGARVDAHTGSGQNPAFVQALFDEASQTFDEKLTRLEYAVPRGLGLATAKHVRASRGGRPFASALDAGCGTGRLGSFLRPLVSGTLAGSDLSPKMLAIAAELRRGAPSPGSESGGGSLYDHLVAKDLLTVSKEDLLPTAEASAGVELVAAADVLIYFGNLAPLFAAMSSLSTASAVLAVSAELVHEQQSPQGWSLLRSGRFAHTKEYVVETASRAGGFDLVQYEEQSPRTEYGKPLAGHLFVFAR